MHRTARIALAAAAVAVLSGAGCSTTIPGLAGPSNATPAAPAAGVPTETDGVAWMDKVCGSMLPAVKTLSTPPSINAASDPAAAVAALSRYLEQAGTSVDGAITGMAAAGPSPLKGGDEAVTALTDTLTTLRDSVRESKTKLDAIDTSNPQALATQLPAAVAPLSKLQNLPNPTADLESSPELDQAAAQAAQCQQLETAFK